MLHHYFATSFFFLQKKAIEKLRNSSGQIQIVSHDPNRPQIGASSQLSSNDKMKKRLEEKVAANRKDLGSKNKENKNSVKKGIKVAISSIYPHTATY